jgi:hypothetical protein
MAELATGIIRIVAEEVKDNTVALASAVAACTSAQSTWVFGDEEVLPTSAQLQAALTAYEALSPGTLSIADSLAAVRSWAA